MKRCLSFLFSFQGHTSRRDFWIVVLILLIWGDIFSRLVGFIQRDEPVTLALSAINLINFIGVIWIALAAQTKRLRNLGKSKFWLLFNLIPVIGVLVIVILCGFLRGSSTTFNKEGKPI